MSVIAEQFKKLHVSGEPLIMANAWDAGSAVILQEAGIRGIGTTSAGIAFSRAVPDYEGELSFDAALEETHRIANAVKIPVSMDAENGYADTADQVFKHMKKIVATGVVGASIEDHSPDREAPLYDIENAIERIIAARESVDASGSPFTLTARAECFLTSHPDAFRESIKRVNRYREAGADCLFVPGLAGIEMITQFVKEVDGPVSVVMGLSGTPVSVEELAQAGVARISIGGSLARATLGLVRNAAKEMLDKGTFEFAQQQIADNELCQLFSKSK